MEKSMKQTNGKQQTAAMNVVVGTGENIPTSNEKVIGTSSVEFRSQEVSAAPIRRKFGFCLEFECGDCCCCI